MHTASKCASASTYNSSYKRLTWLGRGRCGESLCHSHRANFELPGSHPRFENTYGQLPRYWGLSAQSCCVFVHSHLTSSTPPLVLHLLPVWKYVPHYSGTHPTSTVEFWSHPPLCTHVSKVPSKMQGSSVYRLHLKATAPVPPLHVPHGIVKYWKQLKWSILQTFEIKSHFVVIFQLLNPVQLFVTPWTAACQAPLSFTVS